MYSTDRRLKMKMNKVLIPLDDSEFSLTVLPHVTNLLAPDRNELFLLHVAPKPDSVFVDDKIVIYADQQAASVKEQSREAVEPLVHSLQELGYKVSPEVAFGDPAKEIERFTQAKDIDVVAMATHGREGISRLLHGSVAEHVLHHLHVPLLLLREEQEDWLEDALGE
jgi:nucleotide-binding universal stress UspA family protein